MKKTASLVTMIISLILFGAAMLAPEISQSNTSWRLACFALIGSYLGVIIWLILSAKKKKPFVVISILSSIILVFLVISRVNSWLGYIQYYGSEMSNEEQTKGILQAIGGPFAVVIIVLLGIKIVIAIVNGIKNFYNRGALVYSVQATPQYIKYLEEYESQNGKASIEIEAKLFAKAISLTTLKSPATAIYPELNDMIIQKTKKGYKVNGFVDSQNSYGALVRTTFSYEVNKENNTWVAISNPAAQVGGKVGGKIVIYWIIGIIFSLLSTAIIFAFIMS